MNLTHIFHLFLSIIPDKPSVSQASVMPKARLRIENTRQFKIKKRTNIQEKVALREY